MDRVQFNHLNTKINFLSTLTPNRTIQFSVQNHQLIIIRIYLQNYAQITHTKATKQIFNKTYGKYYRGKLTYILSF